MPHVTVTGGEPFLMGREIFSLLAFLKSYFVRTSFLLLTNGRAFALPGYCEAFMENAPGGMTVGIPLHGHAASLHDGITQAPGSFEQTMLGLRKLLRQGARIELRVVVSKLNAGHIGDIAELICGELPGVACVKVIGLEMLGSAAKHEQQVWLRYSQAFQAAKKAVATLVASQIDVGLYNFPLCAVEPACWPLCEKSISDYKVRYATACDACAQKDACGGVFAGTQQNPRACRDFAFCDGQRFYFHPRRQ
jgi:His-Xaa-Ser system radical SAM maturase HxsC